MNFIVNRAKRLMNRTYRRAVDFVPHPKYRDQSALLKEITSRGIPGYINFNEDRFAESVLSFVDSMRCGDFAYRYSPSVTEPTLYSSIYACLIMAMFGHIDKLDRSKRQAWAEYLGGFQDPHDGLFRDPAIGGKVFENSDWWGARHLVPHAITAFAKLGFLPPHPFSFINTFKSKDAIDRWLGNIDWNASALARSDLDNKIMNVVCALQYERDYRHDADAGMAIDHIFSLLIEARNPLTSLWGAFKEGNPASLSRAVQFGYHLYLPMIYDGFLQWKPDKLIDLALQTQNKIGGFGEQTNSSACEDIDSIDLICRLSSWNKYRSGSVLLALERSLPWQLANQNDDGGFVFRRNEALTYGHPLMSSRRNESALFPTWFRSLSICYTTKRLGKAKYQIGIQPGYQFWLD